MDSKKDILIGVKVDGIHTTIQKYENDYYDIQNIRAIIRRQLFPKKKWNAFTKRMDTQKQTDLIKKLHKAEPIIIIGSNRKQLNTFIHKDLLVTFFNYCEIDISNNDILCHLLYGVGDIKNIQMDRQQKIEEKKAELIALGYEFNNSVNISSVHKKERGYVYCMSHPLFVGTYKIGKTVGDPAERASELCSTEHYLEFKVEFAKLVDDMNKVESSLHTILSSARVRPDREFFTIPLDDIRKIFKLIVGEDYVVV